MAEVDVTQQLPELDEHQTRLRDEAAQRRGRAGPPRFPLAWQQAQADYAKKLPVSSAPRPTVKAKRLLQRLPVVGPVGRFIATLVRLPERLGRMDLQLATTRAEVEARADARLELRIAQLRGELLEQNHQRHLASQKLLAHIEQLQSDLNTVRGELRSTLQQLEHRARSAGPASPGSVPAGAAPSPLTAALLDEFYWQFEERFRGSASMITERLQVYLPYLEGLRRDLPSKPLLDIGCGRGEWLKLVASHGVQGQGVDLNARMVRECQAASLDVRLGDALAHLQAAGDQSLAAVTGFHIVEHIPFAVLMALFQEAYRVLAPGGLVLFETPNPENILVGACTFYTDPTHQNPIPPPTLGFMLNTVGFRRQDCLRLRPTPLAHVPSEPEVADVVARFHEGSDYAIVAFKDRLEL